MHKFGYIYLTTATLKNKVFYYVGQHVPTKSIEIGEIKKEQWYVGSGSAIRTLKKKGADFKVKVLKWCKESEMNAEEQKAIARYQKKYGDQLVNNGKVAYVNGRGEDHYFHGVRGKDHPRFGHLHSNETKAVMADKKRGANNPKAIQITVVGKGYRIKCDTVNEARQVWQKLGGKVKDFVTARRGATNGVVRIC